jgi:phosphonoacetaldehyde hydrolase
MRTLRAVIFDWAGTAVDFGSRAPVAAFSAAFAAAGVPIPTEEIRKPMGLEKRRHLEVMLSDSGVAKRWRGAHGRVPDANDVDALYRAFDDQLAATVARYADPVPGLPDTLAALRSKGIKIGSNTGYSARIMEILAPASMQRGFAPDCIVSASDVAHGRPAPDLSWKCLDLLDLSHDTDAIKVDDTVTGIEEGRNAGLWTIGVAISGNEVGLSYEEWSSLTEAEQHDARERAYGAMEAAKPDYIIDSVAEMAEVVEAIERRISDGEHAAAR